MRTVPGRELICSVVLFLMDEQSGHLFHALPHKGLQSDLLRREICMDRTDAQIAQHHVLILFGLEQLLGKGAAARDIRAFLQQKAWLPAGFDCGTSV